MSLITQFNNTSSDKVYIPTAKILRDRRSELVYENVSWYDSLVFYSFFSPVTKHEACLLGIIAREKGEKKLTQLKEMEVE